MCACVQGKKEAAAHKADKNNGKTSGAFVQYTVAIVRCVVCALTYEADEWLTRA